MPSHTRRGAVGTTVCVGFVFVSRCADRFVCAGVARRILLLLSVFVSVCLSVVDSIKLGRGVSLGEMSCGSTGCLSCRGKQSTSSLLLLLSSTGRSFSILL